MTIKGVTDNVLPAFPRLGKLRKGSPRDADGKIGKEQSFWRFASERAEVVAAFTTAYGEQPVRINVLLPYVKVEDCFATFVEEWSAGGMVHRCDGETMLYWRTPTGAYSDEPRPCPYFAGEKKRSPSAPGCKPVGRLTVIIPELVYAGFVGYVTMETHSINDLLSIQACLLAVAEARAGNERGLQGVPFVLCRVAELISTPGEDGNRVRRKKFLAKLEPVADWVALQLEASRRLAFGDERRLALPDGRRVDTATGEVEEGDWGPDEEDDGEEAEADAHAPARTSTDEHGEPAAQGNGNGPACPKCGGPMWDNRGKIVANPGKKMPEWSCKAGKWNPTTKAQEGCDGVLWPGQWKDPKSTGNGAKQRIALADDARELWKQLAPELAAKVKRFAKADGSADHQGIGDAMAAAGFTEVNAANIVAAFDRLYSMEAPL
jgi:hypothetical protein